MPITTFFIPFTEYLLMNLSELILSSTQVR
jgi:hypothetical protein